MSLVHLVNFLHIHQEHGCLARSNSVAQTNETQDRLSIPSSAVVIVELCINSHNLWRVGRSVSPTDLHQVNQHLLSGVRVEALCTLGQYHI